MYETPEPDDHLNDIEGPTDMYEDMTTLNMLYEELCWDHKDVLHFFIEDGRIIIRNKTLEKK